MHACMSCLWAGCFGRWGRYEACQLLWAETLYGKSTPDGLQFWVYGLTMIAEYFSMIFVRSYTAIRYFPRYYLPLLTAGAGLHEGTTPACLPVFLSLPPACLPTCLEEFGGEP